jgi:hypothetical protein
MNKFILLLIVIISLGYQNVFAIATSPMQTVSIEPINAEIDKAIKINALIYNDQKESITFGVNFSFGEKIIGTQSVLIGPLSAKTVSISWTQPKEKTEIVVSIVSSVTKNKKDIKSLQGVLGTITLGQDSININTDLENKATGIFSSIYSNIEKFRLKQSLYFGDLRDKTKRTLGMQIKEDLIKKIAPIFKAPSGPTFEGDTPSKLGELDNSKLDNPKEYGILIFTTSMASLFGNSIMFYGVLAFMVLYIIRTLFKMFI